MTFTDNLMIPAKAEHVYAAETMINYVYEPEVAAKIALYVNYLSPVKGVKEIVEKSDPELANNPLVFPSDEIRAKLHAYPTLSDADERTMKEAMAKVTGA
jgi:spermidine/putrescine transport system substrate-binding protein